MMQLSSNLFAQARSKPFGEVLKVQSDSGEVSGYVVGNTSFLGWATHWIKYCASGKYRTRVLGVRAEIATTLTDSLKLSRDTVGRWDVCGHDIIRSRRKFLRLAAEVAKATEVEHSCQLLSEGGLKEAREQTSPHSPAGKSTEGVAGGKTFPDTDPKSGSQDDVQARFAKDFFQTLKGQRLFHRKFDGPAPSTSDRATNSSPPQGVEGYSNSLVDRYLVRERNCIVVSQLELASRQSLCSAHGLSAEQGSYVDWQFIEYVSAKGKEQRGEPVQLYSGASRKGDFS